VVKSHESSTNVPFAQVMRPGKEEVALLSARYAVPASDVDGILVTYLTEHDFRFGRSSQISRASNDYCIADIFVTNPDGIPITLSNLSTQYQVSSEKVASLVIDFRLMRRAYR